MAVMFALASGLAADAQTPASEGPWHRCRS
jgi:hypothetical protein